MTLRVLQGKIQNLTTTRAKSSFLLSDRDKGIFGTIAAVAGATGQAGAAAGVAQSTSQMLEEADIVRFDIDGETVEGWLWRSPFKEGDQVEVVVEAADGPEWLWTVLRSADRTIALYPHCIRGIRSHWRNAWRWWFKGSLFAFVFTGIGMEIIAWLMEGESWFFGQMKIVAWLMLPMWLTFWAPYTLIVGRRWRRFGQISEKIFSALGWEDPTNIDLSLYTKSLKKEGDPFELGRYYFHY